MNNFAPSSFGRAWGNKGLQEKLQYRCHRPSKFFGPHVSVFHPVFNLFTQIFLQGETTLTEEDSQFTLQVCQAMSESFDSEDARVKTFNRLLGKYLGKTKFTFLIHIIDRPMISIVMNREGKRDVTNDGGIAVPVPMTGSQGLVLSIEGKPEIGKGHCCAYMEAIAYHSIFATGKDLQLLKRSCCPSLMCILAGPYL